jgi:AraC-like DNA-binding protein
VSASHQPHALAADRSAAGRSVRIVSHQSEHGRWQLVFGEPAPRLRGCLARPYLGYSESATRFLRRIEVASPIAVLIVTFDPLLVIDPRRGDEPLDCRAFFGGLSDSHVVTETTGAAQGVQVDFSPLGAYQLLGLSMSDTANRTVALDELFGRAGRQLVERLHEEATWEGRFAALDAFFGERLQQARTPAPGVAWAWRRLTESAGRIAIADLAREVGWSQKHLIARFRDQIGMPPKICARLLRFERAMRHLKRGGADASRFADLAHACGYYDQAHFIRDCHAFAGRTPGELVAHLLPDEGGIAGG